MSELTTIFESVNLSYIFKVLTKLGDGIKF